MKIDTSNKSILAARVVFSVISGAVVAAPSMKWALEGGGSSKTFVEAANDASTKELIVASFLAFSVLLGNACQYFDGIQDNTTNIKKRTKNFFLDTSCFKAGFIGFSVLVLSLLSGFALGGLYQQEFENDNVELRFFIFIYMTLIGFTFTREVNYSFVDGCYELVKQPKQKLSNIVETASDRPVSSVLFLISFTAYYFMLGKNCEAVIKPLLFNKEADFSLPSLLIWGVPTAFVGATFAKLTSLVFDRLLGQLKEIKKSYQAKNHSSLTSQILYFLFGNIIALASSASLFAGVSEATKQGEYDALGFLGKHYQYFVGPLGALANVSAMAQVFNYLVFGIQDESNKKESDDEESLLPSRSPPRQFISYGSINS